MIKISKKLVNRFKGSLIGLAVGDALGVPLEFKIPGTFKPVKEMLGGGPFNLNPGEWTDDTSLALCLAESLIHKGFNPYDQLERYTRWYQEGYLSVNGKCFDIGNTTREALERFMETGCKYCGPDYERSAGNGSIMRLTPVPLYYFFDPVSAIERSGDSSRTTHQHPLCIDACRFLGGLIAGAIRGESKKKLLSAKYSPIKGFWDDNSLSSEIYEVACGSFKEKQPPDIRGSGYVVRSLEAALWSFYNSENFEDGCLLAVNLGEDADTTGAVYGQIAGAYYGEDGIPSKWKDTLARYDLLTSMIEELFKASIDLQKRQSRMEP